MRPMSENLDAQNIDSETQLISQTIDEKNDGGELEVKSQPESENEKSTVEENDENEVFAPDFEKQDSVESVERQSSVETVRHQSSTEENAPQETKETNSSPKFIGKKRSYSEWSETYESLEDERTVEDLDGDPEKLILWAAEKNEIETMRKLLEENPSLVNTRDTDLYTPLHRACYSNSVEVIQLLLQYEADISSTTTDGWQPLHCACKWDSVEAVSLLLQNGADVNAQTKGHITPLHLAASNVSGRRTLELLLWHPYIDPNLKNDAGDTPLDIANRTGPCGALFEILEESVNVY